MGFLTSTYFPCKYLTTSSLEIALKVPIALMLKNFLAHNKYSMYIHKDSADLMLNLSDACCMFNLSDACMFNLSDACCCMLQLLYGLQYYKGDERIKEFISDLIAQEKEGGLKNHSGIYMSFISYPCDV